MRYWITIFILLFAFAFNVGAEDHNKYSVKDYTGNKANFLKNEPIKDLQECILSKIGG